MKFGRSLGVFGVTLLAVALLMGCSEERKQEALKLEDQLKGDTVAAVAAVASEPVQDTRGAIQSVTRDTSVQDSLQPAVEPKDSTTPASINTDQRQVTSDTVKPAATTLAATEQPADVNAIPDETSSSQTATGMPAQPHDGFTIQIGSTPSETYAQEMAKSFLGRGFQAYVASVTIEGKTYYRVRIGFYPAAADAQSTLQELKDKYSVDGWIDQVTK